jgi:hypothetical protein
MYYNWHNLKSNQYNTYLHQSFFKKKPSIKRAVKKGNTMRSDYETESILRLLKTSIAP